MYCLVTDCLLNKGTQNSLKLLEDLPEQNMSGNWRVEWNWGNHSSLIFRFCGLGTWVDLSIKLFLSLRGNVRNGPQKSAENCFHSAKMWGEGGREARICGENCFGFWAGERQTMISVNRGGHCWTAAFPPQACLPKKLYIYQEENRPTTFIADSGFSSPNCFV